MEPRERKINLNKANLWGIAFMILLIPVYGLPYLAIWGHEFSWQYILQAIREPSDDFTTLGFGIIMLIMIVGIVVHELIHGITWAMYCQNGWRSIRFGVIWKALTPYCHCQEAMPNKHYLKAILMPGLVLGFLPALLAIVIGNSGMMIYGWFFTGAAAGDILMARMLFQENPNVLVKDMDDEAGFWIYDTEQGAPDSDLERFDF